MSGTIAGKVGVFRPRTLVPSYQVRVSFFSPKDEKEIGGIVLGKKINGHIPIYSNRGFEVIQTTKNTEPMWSNSIQYEASMFKNKEGFSNPGRIARNIQKLWNYPGLLDYQAQVPRLLPHARAWVTFYPNGIIRNITDTKPNQDESFAELLSSRSDLVIGKRYGLPPDFESEDLATFNWYLIRPNVTEEVTSTLEKFVLGVNRNGFIPQITNAGYSVIRSSLRADPISSKVLDGTSYNIQRLWAYAGLWEKDSEVPKLRLDETWVILDQKGNIAMLRKEDPEEIPYGYEEIKIEPIDCCEFDSINIRVSSLREAIQNFNFILSQCRPVKISTPPELQSPDLQVTSDTSTVTLQPTISIHRESTIDDIPEDKITASIIYKLLQLLGKDLTDMEVRHLQSDNFEIKNPVNRLRLIREGAENRAGRNFPEWGYLGMSKTILKGLTQIQLLGLNDYAGKNSGVQDHFANGLAENNELKWLLIESKEPNSVLSSTA